MTNFGFHTEGNEVVSVFGERANGKTIIITGASEKGLGAGVAIALARAQPAHILLTARTAPKVQSVIKDINKINPLVKTSFIPIDLSEYDSVRTASKEIESKVAKIDILINNAGVMAIPNYSTNKNGVETTLATNHVGHFLLTNLLMDKIIAAGPGARIVNLTSAGHRISAFRFEDYNFSGGKTYDPWSAYGQSKTANILFSVELARRGIQSFSVHPGAIFNTSLAAHLTMDDFGAISAISVKNTGHDFKDDAEKTQEQGIATTLVAALDPGIAEWSGAFLEDCQISKAREYSSDPENARKLWKLSEDLIGQKFDI